MRKKIGIALLIILAVFIAAAIIVPVAFKGPLMEKLKTAINENINAKVGFDDLHLSLFKGFPKVRAELSGLTITGKDQFENDTLLAVASISTNISLADLVSGRNLNIYSLKITDTYINMLSTQDGLTNWDIFPADSAETTTTTDSTQEMSVSLKNIEIKNMNLTYDDQVTNMILKLRHTDINASGQVEGTLTRFNMDGNVQELEFNYDSVQYISNTTIKAKSKFSADYGNMNFVLGETTLFLNELPLDVTGRIQMPSDSMYFDLQFKQPGSDFKTLLAMVPQSYKSYLEKIDATGEAGFEGHVKGWFYNDDYPEINTHLFIKNAAIQYDGSPEKAEQISLDGKIEKPQGDLDLLMVNVSDAHAQLQGNPVNFSFNMEHPVTDPEFDASFNGKIDFTSLSGIIPMDSLEMKGTMEGQMTVKGKMSDIEQQNYDQVSSSGSFAFNNFMIRTPAITRPFEISSGTIQIDNSQIVLSSFKAKTGQSDFTLNGRLSNYLPYFFLNKTLQGNFNLKSNYLNLDELSSFMAETDTTAAVATQDSIIAFEVPANLKINMHSEIDRASFNGLDIRNIIGMITISDKKLELQKLNMDMLDGQMTITGNYASNSTHKPEFDFNIAIASFRIPAAYKSSGIIKQYVPIASRSQGQISSTINMKGQFDEKLDIIPSSMNGNGSFSTKGLQIVDSPTFLQIKSIIKEEKLRNVKIDDFTAHFKMDNGNLNISPFQTRIADQEVSVYGGLSAARQLNMAMDFRVNRDNLSNDVNKALGILPGSGNIKLIDASVLLKGDLKNPDVSLDLSKARKQIEEEVKKSTKEEVQKSVKKIGDQLKKLFN